MDCDQEDVVKTLSELPFLALASIYGEVRKMPDAWPIILTDLSLLPDYNLTRIARFAQISPRSLNRLVSGKTENPRFLSGLKLVLVHLALCPHRYDTEGILLR